MMAICKLSWTKDTAAAKDTIRYISHRPNRDGARRPRELWGPEGRMSRQAAYELIDGAAPKSTFYRVIIAPDPQREDGPHDLHLRQVTEATMARLEEQANHQVEWVASVHDDHTDHRHVHVVAVARGKVNRADLQALREAATQACAQQRWERDAQQAALGQQTQASREEPPWDRELS